MNAPFKQVQIEALSMTSHFADDTHVATFQMENITKFLKFCEAYGVPKTGTFQTVDLFEGRNMAQVLNCVQQLGTEVDLLLILFEIAISMY